MAERINPKVENTGTQHGRKPQLSPTMLQTSPAIASPLVGGLVLLAGVPVVSGGSVASGGVLAGGGGGIEDPRMEANSGNVESAFQGPSSSLATV
jgi:hypothetical protein